MAYKTIETRLATDLAPSGTLQVSYPTGLTRGDFLRGRRHKMIALESVLESPNDFTVSFGSSAATITYNGATTIPAGSRVVIQLDRGGPDSYREDYDLAAQALPDRVRPVQVRLIELGSPLAADDDAIRLNAAISAEGELALDGARVADGVAVADVPRNVIITSAGNDTGVTFTVTGTDEYGERVVEAITGANGAAAAGKKAFKTVRKVEASGASAGNVKVGFGDVLGLPVRLPNSANVLKEMEDGAAAASGTIVAGLAQGTKSTATTADVRGTYDPNSACDGSKSFSLLVALSDPADKGNPQYAG